MQRTIQVGKLEEQDEIRRRSVASLDPNERVAVVLEMQSNYLRWDLNPHIERVVKIKRMNFKGV
ncbi:hypothetical protein PQO01_18410 [Lentisphaera marina]|uniref:hypothetical protein n=1 Tax=Lentisphaera marina TaxID=1111041 RepID=UPI0023652AFD|nr:hypothetical protein [Lentisphaera marina]MDD7986926.1 hypothetical protein [Lentisphaera marina]